MSVVVGVYVCGMASAFLFGRYDAVLELLLALDDLQVNYLDTHGRTARVVALDSGNVRVQRRVLVHPRYAEAWELLPRLFRETGGRDGAWRESWCWATNKPLAHWKGVVVEERKAPGLAQSPPTALDKSTKTAATAATTSAAASCESAAAGARMQQVSARVGFGCGCWCRG